MNKENLAKSALWSSTATIIVIFLMTVFSDKNPGFKAWLTSMFSHHWIGKSVLSVVVFVILFLLFYIIKPKISLVLSVWVLAISAGLFTFLTFVFFALETFKVL